MNPGPGALAEFMGSGLPADPRCPADSTWWPNDGVANTISMDGPSLVSGAAIVPPGSRPRPGVWNFMGTLEPFDHLNVVRMGLLPLSPPGGYGDLLDWYLSLAALMASLPP